MSAADPHAVLDDLADRRRRCTQAITTLAAFYLLDPAPWLDETAPVTPESMPPVRASKGARRATKRAKGETRRPTGAPTAIQERVPRGAEGREAGVEPERAGEGCAIEPSGPAVPAEAAHRERPGGSDRQDHEQAADSSLTACAGVNGRPCAQGKTVKTSGGQCPDCRLEVGRMRLRQKFDRKREERERLARIAEAAPPAHTVDGQLQRHRDRQADERGDPRPGAALLEDDVETEGEPDPDAADVDAELLDVQPAASRRRGRPLSIKTAHRQSPPPGDTRGESWWLKVRPGDSMTAAATQELDRMRESKEGKRMYRQLGSEVE
jgi:hypothetical protein